MQAIMTKFVGPTAIRGSRIVATTADSGKYRRIRVVYNHLHDENHDTAHTNAALALCRKMNWTGCLVHGSWGAGCEMFVWVNLTYEGNRGDILRDYIEVK